MKQTNYKIALSEAIESINKASDDYEGLQFGDCSPQQLIDAFQEKADKEEFISMSKASRLLHHAETRKLIGGANRGIQSIRRALRENQIAIDS